MSLRLYIMRPDGWAFVEKGKEYYCDRAPAAVQRLYEREGWARIVHSDGVQDLTYPQIEVCKDKVLP